MIIGFHQCRPRVKFPLVAWIIMLFQKMFPWKKESYSHIAMSYYPNQLSRRFIDSTGHGVRDRLDKNFLHNYSIVRSIFYEYSSIDHVKMRKWVESIEETHYDHLGIFGQLMNIITGKKLNIGSRWKKLSCQEIPLHFFHYFFANEIKNSDDYDLRSSWDYIRQKTCE